MISITSDIADKILQQTLNQNTLGLNNAIQRMTSGYKINHAKDNAANYSISKNLSVKISAMLQLQQNAADGIDMLQTAEGGLSEIQNLLEKLRSLAMQASNDTYGLQSREAMQAEADEIIAQISQITDSTEYNGIKLYSYSGGFSGITGLISQNNDSSSISEEPVKAVKSRTRARASAALSSDPLEDSINFAAGQKLTVNIDGVNYTITNQATGASVLSYSKDSATGEVTFTANNFKIEGQLDVAHNIKISGKSNTVYGGNLDDTITLDSAQSSNNTIYAGKGNDTIVVKKAENTTVFGEEGDDTFNITDALSVTVKGGDGNDTFNLKNVYGSFYGEAGEDSFYITETNRATVDGGSGTNYLEVDKVSTNVTSINVPGANSFSENFSSGQSKVLNINGINYEVTRTGADANFNYSVNSEGAILFKTSGYKIVGEKNKAHNVVLVGQSIVFYGGDLEDKIKNNTSNNIIYGLGGNDTISTSTGYVTIHGGDGDDTISVDGMHLTVFGDGGNDTILIRGSDAFIDTGDGDDTVKTLTNNSDGLVINGNSGNNTLELAGTLRQSLIAGFGAGVDNAKAVNLSANETKNIAINNKNYEVKNLYDKQASILYSYDNATEQIELGSVNSKITAQQDVQHNVLIRGGYGVVDFTGGNLDDTIISASHGNDIHGGAGNDTLITNSYAEDTTLYGDDGDDTLIMDSANNSLRGGEGDDTITLNATTNKTVDAGPGNNTLNINSNNNKNIVVDSGDNLININGSSNKITAGDGDNTVIISGSSNNITTGNGDDSVTIKGSSNKVVSSGGDNDFIIKGGSNSIQGGSGIDTIKINGSNNTANGGGANDIFIVGGIKNNIDGEVGDKNIMFNTSSSTTHKNVIDITPRDFELNLKVDLGSSDDAFIKTKIGFNLFGLSVDLSSDKSALDSIASIDETISNLQNQILNIGTVINRLLAVSEAQTLKLQNLISSNSTIKDADVAEESSSYIRYQILQQAGATLMSSSRNIKAENVLGLINSIR